MAKNYWKIVNDVIKRSDVVLEIIDARLPDESRNIEVEKKVLQEGKKLIIVINKCDLVNKKTMDDKKKQIKNSVFVSAREMLGTTILKTKILEAGKKDSIIVGVVGYPNTGKSSVINALAGKSKAGTSSMSGHTKSEQLIRAGKRIMLIDTPGVFPFMEEDDYKHAFISAEDYTKIDDPEDFVLRLILELEGKIEKHYGLMPNAEPEEALESIAIKHNRLKKGKIPDTKTMARDIIRDWQQGRIKV